MSTLLCDFSIKKHFTKKHTGCFSGKHFLSVQSYSLNLPLPGIIGVGSCKSPKYTVINK